MNLFKLVRKVETVMLSDIKTQLKSYDMIENKLASLLVSLALPELIALWYRRT